VRGDRLAFLSVGLIVAAAVYRRRSRAEGTVSAIGVVGNAATDIAVDGVAEVAEPLVASLNRRPRG